MAQSITSASAVFTITVPGLFDTPIKLENWAADTAWAADGVDLAEIMMSIDGIMSSGYRPNPVSMTLTLMADSASVDVFDAIYRATTARRDTYSIYATIDLPSIRKSYTCKNGVLMNYKPIPDGGTVLQPQAFNITWERIDPTII